MQTFRVLLRLPTSAANFLGVTYLPTFPAHLSVFCKKQPSCLHLSGQLSAPNPKPYHFLASSRHQTRSHIRRTCGNMGLCSKSPTRPRSSRCGAARLCLGRGEPSAGASKRSRCVNSLRKNACRRSRCGAAQVCPERGEPSAEIVSVEALSLRRRAMSWVR